MFLTTRLDASPRPPADNWSEAGGFGDIKAAWVKQAAVNQAACTGMALLEWLTELSSFM